MVLASLAVIFAATAVAGVLVSSVPVATALLYSFGAFVLSALVSGGLSLWEYRSMVGDYERRVLYRPDILYGQVADKFKNEITEYRTRMLGPQSDWHKAWDPLKQAQDEANRSIAYWGERLRQGGDSEVVEKNIEIAEDLSLKFTRALEELDRRSDALLTFLNECYAKLAVLEGSRTDYAESQRLAALSEQAAVVVEDAESVLDRIGQQFLEEATRLGGALGALRALHLKEIAGEVPLDQIEHVADRILEVYHEDSDALKNLVESITGKGPAATGPDDEA